MHRNALFDLQFDAQIFFHQTKCPLHRPADFLGLDRLKFKHRRAAQNRVIDIKIGVFGRGGDEGNVPVFDVFQQRLLLFFVQVLNFIEVEQNPIGGGQGIDLPDDVLNICRGGRRPI